jgi:hypothetical protein
MNELHPIDLVAVTELMRSPIIVRIVSILNITNLSILELLEYSLTLRDLNYSITNGVICYYKPTKSIGTEETTALGIPLTGDYYYNFLNSKVKLTELGLYILDSIKGEQLEQKSFSILDQTSDASPRHQSTIN